MERTGAAAPCPRRTVGTRAPLERARRSDRGLPPPRTCEFPLSGRPVGRTMLRAAPRSAPAPRSGDRCVWRRSIRHPSAPPHAYSPISCATPSPARRTTATFWFPRSTSRHVFPRPRRASSRTPAALCVPASRVRSIAPGAAARWVSAQRRRGSLQRRVVAVGPHQLGDASVRNRPRPCLAMRTLAQVEGLHVGVDHLGLFRRRRTRPVRTAGAAARRPARPMGIRPHRRARWACRSRRAEPRRRRHQRRRTARRTGPRHARGAGRGAALPARAGPTRRSLVARVRRTPRDLRVHAVAPAARGMDASRRASTSQATIRTPNSRQRWKPRAAAASPRPARSSRIAASRYAEAPPEATCAVAAMSVVVRGLIRLAPPARARAAGISGSCRWMSSAAGRTRRASAP